MRKKAQREKERGSERERERNKQTERQTERQTDRQADRQADRHYLQIVFASLQHIFHNPRIGAFQARYPVSYM